MVETLERRERLYKAIADVKDLPTRNILYIQFISKYYPEAFESMFGVSKK